MGLTISKFSDIKNVFFEEEKLNYLDEVRNYNDEAIIVIKKIKTLEELENNYVKVTDIVAGYIQDKLTKKSFNDNLKWNIYLIFIVEKEAINIGNSNLIDKIEKNKYCCKKYVFSLKNSRFLNEEIEKHLPIFIDLNRNDLKGVQTKNEIERNSKEFPKTIKGYLTDQTITLEKFLEMPFDLKLIKEIYKGEEDED